MAVNDCKRARNITWYTARSSGRLRCGQVTSPPSGRVAEICDTPLSGSPSIESAAFVRACNANGSVREGVVLRQVRHFTLGPHK